MKTLHIDKIEREGGTQIRSALSHEYIQSLREAKACGVSLPPAIVFYDGTKYWLADGFHRVAAVEDAGGTKIDVEIRPGTRRDAILYACGANASHGLRRTNADKRRAVETLLRDQEWAAWSNVEIAKACGVSEFLVRELRPAASIESKVPTRRGADGKTYDVTNIGRKVAPAPAPESSVTQRPQRQLADMVAPAGSPRAVVPDLNKHLTVATESHITEKPTEPERKEAPKPATESPARKPEPAVAAVPPRDHVPAPVKPSSTELADDRIIAQILNLESEIESLKARLSTDGTRRLAEVRDALEAA